MNSHLREATRPLDAIPVKGKAESVEVHELLWHSSSERTVIPGRAAPRLAESAGSLVLRLTHRGRETVLAGTATFGRDAENTVVISDPMCSRRHARIERRASHFALVDQSSNGTYVTIGGGSEIRLRRGFKVPLGYNAGELERKYGLPEIVRMTHRADLGGALAALLPPDTARYGHECVGVELRDTSAGVRFANGHSDEADVVIGADGIRKLREEIKKMVGGESHQEGDTGRLFKRIRNRLNGIVPGHIGWDILKLGVVQRLAPCMPNGTGNAVGIIQTL